MATYDDFDQKPPKPGRGVVWRFLLAGLVMFLCAAGATATAALLQVKEVADIIEEFSVPLDEETKGALDDVPAGKPQTLLVLGSDERYQDKVDGNPARSDTIILLRLDPDRGATAVMSIPRDLKVEIPTKNGLVTDKINAAYSLGGPALTVKTVKQLLGIDINHVVNIDFGGFKDAVNTLGCVYVDVDRRYFNDNNPPNGSDYDYATIDIAPGYQRLCGQDALDYVRYRHFDTDLVRAARQQEFLRQAKDQVGVSKLLDDREELLRIFARNTQTDIRGTAAILGLLKLGYESAQNPVQEVQFQAEIGESYVEASPEQLQETVSEFMQGHDTAGPRGEPEPRPDDEESPKRKREERKRAAESYPGTFENPTPAEDQAVQVALSLSKFKKAGKQLPVYYPKLAADGSSYVSGIDSPRAYKIKDRGGHTYMAYRLVAEAEGLGQYYGVQGTNWKAPPILDNPSEERKIRGRTYSLYYDGDRLRVVAWRSSKGSYWITNTLLQTLSERQMLGIAQSLTRLGN